MAGNEDRHPLAGGDGGPRPEGVNEDIHQHVCVFIPYRLVPESAEQVKKDAGTAAVLMDAASYRVTEAICPFCEETMELPGVDDGS